MKKLDQENQIVVTTDVLGLIVNNYTQIGEFNFSLIEEGISNTSLIIQSLDKKYILRIYAQNRSNDEDIMLEVQFQDFLRSHGIPIPVIYSNKHDNKLTISEVDGKRWQCLLFEFLDGESVTIHPSQELITDLATIQAKMHQLGLSFSQEVAPRNKKLIELHDSLVHQIKVPPLQGKEILDFVERVKTFKFILNQELPYGYSHLDIDFDGNVLTKNSKVTGIIDFDDLHYSPAVVCLGYSLWNILDDEGQESMWLYLKEYEKIRPLTEIERETLPHIVFFRNYMIGVIRLFLWDETTDIKDIQDILKLEKEIYPLFSKSI